MGPTAPRPGPLANVLPLAFELRGRSVLVIGAGRVGARKAAQLLEAGARVTVVAESLDAPLPAGLASVQRRRYREGDVAGHWLVVSATGDLTTNDQVVREARAAGTWLNVVDDPGRSSFYFMALHRDGDVCVAVSTSGASPALAQAIRTFIAERLPYGLAAVARRLAGERDALHRSMTSTEGVDWSGRISELFEEERRPSR